MTTANDAAPIYTIGHSNHEEQKFLDLLAAHAIDVLVDVRSQPYCGYSTHFNQEPLKRAVEARGLKYLFLGRELGGRPEGDEFYDEEDHVLYGRVAASEFFKHGVERIERGRGQYRIALMCSEENPLVCHRWLLVTRVLRERGIDVRHIRGDGRLQTDEDLEADDGDPDGPKQKLLFGGEEPPWRSLRSVSRNRPRPGSSDA
ncbi:MAG TPA: DUF488 domain-containing protein [Planctomycetaceae bacterium]|nr:DUF488 domain-containing protein [Planctomycetaceae bacterium]